MLHARGRYVLSTVLLLVSSLYQSLRFRYSHYTQTGMLNLQSPVNAYKWMLQEKVVRRWILDGKVAPRFPTIEVESTTDTSADSECPICCWYYIANNTTTCCGKPLCTECYLQVRPPRAQIVCPFCNSSKFGVHYNGPTTAEEVAKRQIEDQRTIEAQIRASREAEQQQEEAAAKRRADLAAGITPERSELQLRAEALLPGRSNSIAGSSGSGSSTPYGSSSEFARRSAGIAGRSQSLDIPLATVAARRQLESEMRLQHTPPTPRFISGLAAAAAAAAGTAGATGNSSSSTSGSSSALPRTAAGVNAAIRRQRRQLSGSVGSSSSLWAALGEATEGQRSNQDLIESFTPHAYVSGNTSTTAAFCYL
jgi:hypothetical protein